MRLKASPSAKRFKSSPVSAGLKDFACPGVTNTEDQCACQIKCKTSGCEDGFQACARLGSCDVLAFNEATAAMASYATLKTNSMPVPLNVSDLRARARHAKRRAKRSSSPKLGKALGPEAARGLRTHASALCGPANEYDLTKRTLGILAITYRTPLSLEASMRSWWEGGLVKLAAERVLIASDPLPEEELIADAFGFTLVQPSEMGHAAKLRERNVITIGAAFAWGMKALKSDYILFLEKDFALHAAVVAATLHREIYGAAQQLERGASVVYLRTRHDMGCGSFLDCNKVRWAASGGMMERKTNWWKFYCPAFAKQGRVDRCLDGGNWTNAAPHFRCYTSEDSNWSLNAAMLHRKRALRKKIAKLDGRRQTLVSLAREQWLRQDGFESLMIERNWGAWKVPICLSYHGLFAHAEVDG